MGQDAKLTIHVTNIDEVEGQILVAIFDKPDGFPDRKYMYDYIIHPVTANEHVLVFEDLPLGYYAISMLHDANMDMQPNFNFIGFPTEGFGFSNNVRPVFKAPSFEKTKFEIIEDQEINIKLIN